MYKDLRQALRHLHDPVYLGGIDSLVTHLPTATTWERGKALQTALIKAIRPPERLTSVSDQWTTQQSQILWRLYYEGHSRQDIMRDLSLSERHYERKLREALETLAAQWQDTSRNYS